MKCRILIKDFSTFDKDIKDLLDPPRKGKR
jgi:hypothetical protein